MTYTIETLTEDVMARLGENARPLSASESEYGLPSARGLMERRVTKMLPEAGSTLILEASACQLAGGEPAGEAHSMQKLPCGLYGAMIGMPADFLRICTVKMAGWQSPVTEAVGIGSGDSGRKWSKHPGIAGCPSRPRVYVGMTDSGLMLTAVGSESATDTPDCCLIWRIPKADAEGRFRFPEALYPALVTLIATSLR